MGEDLTWGVDDQSHLDHELVGGYDDRPGEGKAGTSQGEVLYDHKGHAAECSFYLTDKELDHQSLLDSMTSSRIGQAEARASGSHRSHVAEEVPKDSPVEGLQVCGSPWQVVAVDSRSIYRAEDSFGESHPPCIVDSLVVVDNPWRAGSYLSKERHCDDFHDGCFLRG